MNTQNIDFDKRQKTDAIQYEGSAKKVCEGCTVDLVQNGTTISARIQSNENNLWTGEITGFPSKSDENEIGDLKVGNTITFEDCHIFRCAA